MVLANARKGNVVPNYILNPTAAPATVIDCLMKYLQSIKVDI